MFQYVDPKNGLKDTEGYAAELMKIATEKLNFTVKFVPAKSFGTVKPDGTATGMVGVLQRGVGIS